jgi:hypothetical protein
MLVTFRGLLCRTEFGGVWSTIVIDDCYGSYWTPTTSLTGREGGIGTPSPVEYQPVGV